MTRHALPIVSFVLLFSNLSGYFLYLSRSWSEHAFTRP